MALLLQAGGRLLRRAAGTGRCSWQLSPHDARQLRLAATEASAAASTSASASAAAPQLPAGDAISLLRAYKQLSKFNLSVFVVSTACAGYALGSGESIDTAGMAWTAAGTFGASASANTLNQVFEARWDALMKRTRGRPLPSGAITPRHALLFAAGAGVAGVSILWAKTNALTAGLGAANIGLYALVYTPLKRVTVANTWVGAVVGAVPPLMGWAAATGGLEAGALPLAALLYFWQLPHFMALAFLYRADYAAGGYRMLPLVDASGRRTAGVAIRNSLAMVPLGLLACHVGISAPPLAPEAAVISSAMALAAGLFAASSGQGSARRLFLMSLVHLPVLQAALVLHRVPNTPEARLAASQDTLPAWLERTRDAAAAERYPPSEATAAIAPTYSLAPFPFLPAPALAATAGADGAAAARRDGAGGLAGGLGRARLRGAPAEQEGAAAGGSATVPHGPGAPASAEHAKQK